ncbi:phage replication initiation protein, NGO0469 family [Guyparkeria sp.]|uniref:phage replication initiation protein, NGO0469 family n=1 Tax=Guyparkeria sp. TaxID=2035736 RepID=UPI0039709081
MMITAPTTTFEQPPAGMHVARCYRLIDLGTQTTHFNGEPKRARKLLVSFELLGEDRMDDGRPFTVSRRFTASLADKAALRGFLESWRGRRFAPEEIAEGFDLGSLLDKFAMLNLVESEREGRTYINIASASPMPKGMPAPEGENPAQMFDLSAPDWDLFAELSDRLQEQIMTAPEYQAARPAGSAAPTDTADDDGPAF